MTERIEFMGIPGSGKSTLCKKVFTELDVNCKVDFFNNAYKKSIIDQVEKQNIGFIKHIRFLIINKLLRGNYRPAALYSEVVTNYMVENGLVFTEMLTTIIDTIDPDRRPYVLKYLLNDIYKWEIIKGNNINNNLVLMDEGFVHRWMNVYMNYDDIIASKLISFLSTIGFPSLVVNVKCDIKEAIKRMQNRKQGIPVGFKGYNRTELINRLSLMDEVGEIMVKILQNEGVTVITVNNTDFTKAKYEILEATSFKNNIFN